MLQELLTWAHLNDLKVVAAQSASNLLLVLYVISYIVNRKAVFLTAFLFVEFYGNLSVFSFLSDYQYYLGYLLIYSLAYWVVFKRYGMVKILFGYGIMLLFQGAMTIDAKIYPEDETLISSNYVIVVMVIHLYIIASSVGWKPLRTLMGEGFNCLRSMFCNSYSLSFLWYNLLNTHKTTK